MIRLSVAAIFAAWVLLSPLSAASPTPMEQAKRSDVTIQAGEVVLGATLYRPAGAKGRLPAVVTVHGSAPTTRTGVGFYTNTALRMGLAVLSFDKRGTGVSTGTFEEFSVAGSDKQFRALASDVVHSVRWLAQQDGIDPKRIGLMGGSQAGWIMPLAASEEPLVRFIIAGAGVPLSAGAEDIHETYLNAVRDGDAELSWRQVWAADTLAMEYHGPSGYDPAPVLASLKTPILWTFGIYDIAIPTMPSIERIGLLLAEGKRNHTVHVFPYADHNYYNPFTDERYDLATVAKPWLKEIGMLP